MSDAAHLGPFMGLLQSVLAQGGGRYDPAFPNQILPLRGGAPGASAGGAAPVPAPASSGSSLGGAPPVSPSSGTAGAVSSMSGGGGGGGGYTPMATMPSPASGVTPTANSFNDLANLFAGN
jgi:hypothetical protein